jgi:hypothetical protein
MLPGGRAICGVLVAGVERVVDAHQDPSEQIARPALEHFALGALLLEIVREGDRREEHRLRLRDAPARRDLAHLFADRCSEALEIGLRGGADDLVALSRDLQGDRSAIHSGARA